MYQIKTRNRIFTRLPCQSKAFLRSMISLQRTILGDVSQSVVMVSAQKDRPDYDKETIEKVRETVLGSKQLYTPPTRSTQGCHKI
jgi:hypothetical protein